MTTYATLVFTDGRRDCIERTIASFEERVVWPAAVPMGAPECNEPGEHPDHIYGWMFDDSADPEYTRWLEETFPGWTVFPTHARLGFGGNIWRAWRNVVKGPHVDYVFHLEDDFTFNEAVYIEEMVYILNVRPKVAQVALKRQPCHPAEIEAGGFMESWPEGYTTWDSNDRLLTWVEERLFFTTNPSLYRASLCRRGWPVKPGSEPLFSKRLFADPEVTCAFLHGREYPPVVEHIGIERKGTGY